MVISFLDLTADGFVVVFITPAPFEKTHLREFVYLLPDLFTSLVVHRNIITKIHKCVTCEVCMREYLLLLPIIFIFHDMEEVVGFGSFFRKNPWLFDRFPKLLNAYRNITTSGFAAAVYEEFIPIFGISLLAYYLPCDVLYALWYGVFLSIAAHFLIHIGQTVYIRKYIPSFITSLICLPVSVVVLIRAGQFISFDVFSVVLIFAGIVIMMINLKLAHLVMHKVNGKIEIT